MIIVTSAKHTCCACPTIYEGKTEDNRSIYARYRWGYLSIRLSEEGEEDAEFGGEIAGKQVGEPDSGYLDYDRLRELTAEFIQWPAAVD